MENRKRGIESDEDVSRKRRKFGTNLTNLEQNLNIETKTKNFRIPKVNVACSLT